jgi:hypothetical protein
MQRGECQQASSLEAWRLSSRPMESLGSPHREASHKPPSRLRNIFVGAACSLVGVLHLFDTSLQLGRRPSLLRCFARDKVGDFRLENPGLVLLVGGEAGGLDWALEEGCGGPMEAELERWHGA